MVCLAITEASKKWSMPIHNWWQAMVRFIIEFGERFEKQLK
jgi:putative transposase